MAYTIPDDEPKCFSAGDRVQWTRNLTDYPISEGWSLTYYLRGNFAGGQIDITATTSGADFLVDLADTTTANYTPGTYFWQAFVSKSGDRKPVDSGRIDILDNPVDITQPKDGRTHARRCLDSINAVLEGRATRDDLRYVLQAVGRSVEKTPIKDMLAFRDYYQAEVNREENPDGAGKNVFIRFNA